MHPLGLVDTFKDMVGLGKTGLQVAKIKGRRLGNVIRCVVMQLRRAILHGLLRVEYGRQFLVFNVDELQCGIGDFRGCRGNRRHRLAGPAYPVAHHDEILHHALGMGRHEINGGEFVLRHLGRYQHRFHTRQPFRFAGVDTDDLRMGIGAAQQLAVQHAGQAVINDIVFAARYLVISIGTYDIFTDNIQLSHIPVLPVYQPAAAICTASIIFWYPVHLHRFPEMPLRMASSSGSGFSASNCLAAIMMPQVQ